MFDIVSETCIEDIGLWKDIRITNSCRAVNQFLGLSSVMFVITHITITLFNVAISIHTIENIS